MIRAIALVALSTASVYAQDPIPPPVPGVCTTTGGIGVGCSFDLSKLDIYSLALNVKDAVIEMEWCDPSCYKDPYASGCSPYCMYSLPGYPNMTYRVPTNTFLLPETEAGGCFEQKTNSEVENYKSMVGHAAGGGGWFSSWSKVTEDFYGEYYKKDSSLSLQTRNVIWHSMVLPDFQTPKTTLDFQVQVSTLPQTYDYSAYKAFIDQYGTHYMDRSFVGGTATMTAYFHSCLLSQYGGHYVYDQSSSSFLGIFNSGSASKHGFNHTDSKFEKWSQVNVTLVGGDSDMFGTLNFTHFLTPDQSQAWVDSIKHNMLPLSYSLKPLYTLIDDPVIANNMNRSFVEYGVAIDKYNEDLVKSLVPQDPHTTPSWCKYGPHPVPNNSLLEPNEPPLSTGSLPSCPSLPSGDESIHQAREDAFARLAKFGRR